MIELIDDPTGGLMVFVHPSAPHAPKPVACIDIYVDIDKVAGGVFPDTVEKLYKLLPQIAEAINASQIRKGAFPIKP